MDKTDAHLFLEKLERHIINFAPCLTLSLKEQLQCLYQCVKSIRDYLKTIEIEEQDPEVNELEMNIGDLMFDAENIVDLFFAGGGSEDVLVTELARIEEEMESLRSKVERAITTGLFVDPPPVVGLEEKMDLLIRELNNDYQHLPLHLKACFLYLGLFPEDYQIPVRQLIWLWIAEGFVTQQDRSKSLEVTGQDYLNDLVDRNLVFVSSRRYDGGIKTCRIHDLLRDFSVQLGMEEKFLTPRRLCIHSDILYYIISKPPRKLSRSFLCFSKEEANLPNKNFAFISDAFKLARVLHTIPINFPRYPVKLSKLVLLRYLAISGNFIALPPALTSFGNLQSLIVKSTSIWLTIDVKADITSFSNLRHFHTNVASKLCKPAPSANPARSNLQTLSLIAPESCTEDVLGRTPYLKKLGIRGKLAQIVEEKGGSGFDVLIKLKQLERLKLLNDVQPHPPSEGQLSCLPPPSKFPQTIKKLTISETMLHWRHISVLALLPQLEVLKLKYNAFVGHTWNSTAGGFPSLKVLQIGKTDLAFWDGTATDHFPVLETIVLKQCTSLQRFPSGLGDSSSTVKYLDLDYCSSVAVVSATKIKEERENINPLKLVVYPPQK